MLKKFLMTAAAMVVSASCFACWFTESNFNATYIASVNGKHSHYVPSNTISSVVYHNGMSVDLPITVQVKVSPRIGDQYGEIDGLKPVTTAVLQYKIVRTNGTSTGFRTVKSLNNPSWPMNFANPVNLFGATGKIDISENEISKGDHIIIRVYFSDGTYHTGDLNADISVFDVPDRQTRSNAECGYDGWRAPHVFRVRFSGNRRAN